MTITKDPDGTLHGDPRPCLNCGMSEVYHGTLMAAYVSCGGYVPPRTDAKADRLFHAKREAKTARYCRDELAKSLAEEQAKLDKANEKVHAIEAEP